MKAASYQFPQRTMSPVARSLHARLRYIPGYNTDNRIAWVLKSVLKGLKFPRRLTRILSIDQTCKMLVEIGRYRAYQHEQEEAFEHEQARKRH